MSDWHPIETAPKDGTPVLLYCPGIKGTEDEDNNRFDGMPDVVVGLFDGEWGGWIGDVFEQDWLDLDAPKPDIVPVILKPILWAPIPKLPSMIGCTFENTETGVVIKSDP